MPPYVVFHDSVLRDMARYRPASPADLLEIRGVGEKKAQDPGPRFLDAIGKFPPAAVRDDGLGSQRQGCRVRAAQLSSNRRSSAVSSLIDVPSPSRMASASLRLDFWSSRIFSSTVSRAIRR